MRFVRKHSSKAPQVAMTSMLDVIFLLLCFFVTVSIFSQWETEISIKLPVAGSADPVERLPGEVIINLAKDATVKVNGQTLTLTQLNEKLSRLSKFYPGQAVIIRADKDVKYDMLINLVDTCRKANVWNFSLATLDK
jgi:biopolymer transport protein ExbD